MGITPPIAAAGTSHRHLTQSPAKDHGEMPTMPPEKHLHFAELIGEAMQEEPDFYIRLCRRESTAVAKIQELWQREELPVHIEIAKRFSEKYEISAAEAEQEGWRWAQAGFRPTPAMQWARETTSPAVAVELEKRGWTPRTHHAFKWRGDMSIAVALERRLLSVEQIPPAEVGEAARKQHREKHRR